MIKNIIGVHISLPRNTHLWNNPSITIQSEKLEWQSWIQGGICMVSDIIFQNKILTFEQLRNEFNLTYNETFRYLQLKNWLLQNVELNYKAELITVEKIFMNTGVKKKLIGNVYKCLIEAQVGSYSLNKIYEAWNKDLNITDTHIKWKESLNLTNKVTTNLSNLNL